MELLYRGALVIYPLRLRVQYRDQMLQTLHDAYRDRPANALRFWLHAYGDLLQSSLMERVHMIRDSFLSWPLVFHTLTLAAILTVMGGAASLTIDQMLRGGANQPQIDMVNYYVGEIASGEEPANVIPPGYVDLERSLQPILIFYYDQGKTGPGTIYIDKQLPLPHFSVFDLCAPTALREDSGNRVGRPFGQRNPARGGKHLGFVLAARSLRLQLRPAFWRMARASGSSPCCF
jgi:hypothetical protein